MPDYEIKQFRNTPENEDLIEDRFIPDDWEVYDRNARYIRLRKPVAFSDFEAEASDEWDAPEADFTIDDEQDSTTQIHAGEISADRIDLDDEQDEDTE